MESPNNQVMTFRKIVMPDDLNHANTLFGGRLLQWTDEAAVLYAMCQLGTHSVVTLKISEVLFKRPARNGDILEFWTYKKNIGRTSLEVCCDVVIKDFNRTTELPTYDPVKDESRQILSCTLTFVSVDNNGKPTPHKLAKK
jgi:acyl-CoA hydrolase